MYLPRWPSMRPSRSAKKYGNEDSREFINGVLDRVLKDFYKREKQAGKEPVKRMRAGVKDRGS